jgi:hypothetical protein
VEADQRVRDACREGWWVGRPPQSARVLALTIESATFIEWDYARSETTIRRWSPERGYRQAKRSYP